MSVSCPECGRPMRITLRSGRRSWQCTGRFKTPNCSYEQSISDDERLPTEVIARASMQGSDNGDELAKDQAKYRRAAGSLDKVVDESLYLCGEERDALREAARILRRLGDAAEVAKRKKKQWEKAEAERAAKRRAEAYKSLKARYLDANRSPVDLYLVLCAFAQDKGMTPIFDRDRLGKVFDNALMSGSSFAEHLKRELDYDVEREIEEAAQFVGYGHGDLSVALASFVDNIEKASQSLRTREQPMIEAIEDKLAMANDPKVVPLRRR